MNLSMSRKRAVETAEAVKDDVVGRVKGKVEALERDASDMAHDAGRAASDMAHDVRRSASDMAHDAGRAASDMAETVSTRLKTVGVDTDVMVNVAKDQASELQRILGDELKNHPFRALGVAAAVGIFVGLMTSR